MEIWHPNKIYTRFSYILVLLAFSFYCCRSSLLRNSIAVYKLWFFQYFSGFIILICHENYIWIKVYVVRISFLYVYLIHRLVDKSKYKINRKNPGNETPLFLVFRRDHLRSTSGIICGSGSLAVQFGDHFGSGDHLRSGIICCAVQILITFISSTEKDIFIPQ